MCEVDANRGPVGDGDNIVVQPWWRIGGDMEVIAATPVKIYGELSIKLRGCYRRARLDRV